MRIMGLDYGSKTVGVAMSDPMLMTAQGLEIIRRDSENKIRKTFQRLEALVKEYEVDYIVLGLPKNMDDSLGFRAEKTLKFGEDLKRRTGLRVEYWDERLTTVEADEIMSECKIKGTDRKKYVDEIAAMLILQGYLDYAKKDGERNG